MFPYQLTQNRMKKVNNENAEKTSDADEGRCKSLFMASRDAVMTLEPPTWKFTSGNPATMEMFRAKDEAEFLSYEPWKLSPEFQPDGRPSSLKAKDMIEKAMREGTNFFEWTHRRLNGEDFSAEVLLSKVEHQGGDFLHAVVRDITERKKLWEMLEERLASFPKVNPDPIIEVSREEGIIYINPATQKLFPELGKDPDSHPFTKGIRLYFEKLSQKTEEKAEREIYANNRWYLQIITLIAPNTLRLYSADITRLKQAEQLLREEKFKDEAILASIGDAVVATDKDGRIILFNGIAEEMTGFSFEEAIGQNYGRLLKFVREDNEKPSSDFIAEAIKTGKKTEMENHTLLVKKDGSRIPVADSAAPIKNAHGETMGSVVVFRDVSREREIDKAKTEFVSLASHQLRTPLSAISWYAEMLLAGDVGKLNEKQEEYLNEVYRGNRRMIDIVGALLNVSRLELGTFVIEPEPTDILALVLELLNDFKPQVDKKSLTLINKYSDNLPILNVDQKLLRMVFQNLLSNAIKYTPEKGTVEFSLSLDVGKKNMLIKVSDTGCGIPKWQQDKVFTKIFRADNVRQKETEGTGLGLYIAKAIIEQSGGAIWFESEEDKGTTFYVAVPITGMKKKMGGGSKTPNLQ